MKSSAVLDSVRQLFEPRGPIPVLFILGSIALSILGSAIYQLLTNVLGDQPFTLITVAIGAVVIFLFAITGLRWAIARVTRVSIPPVVVSPEQRAAPHSALILPIRLRADGPEMPIARWHARGGRLRHCWLLASPQAEASEKYRNLRQWLVEANVVVHPLSVGDVNQAEQSYRAIREAIGEARLLRGGTPLIVDITSGTKSMTAGAILACYEERTTVQFLPAPYTAAGAPVTATNAVQEPIAIMLRQTSGEEIV